MSEPTRIPEVNDLPTPTADELARSGEVVARVREACAGAGGSIPFRDYMQIALYEPGIGYYSGGLCKFGAGGDFITAPEISPLFAQCIARQAAQALAPYSQPCLFEFGAGSGRMAVDLMLELERLDRLPHRYRILELSAELRERQRCCVEQNAAHLAARFEWLDALPTVPFEGVVVANEVLDAMPVECFRIRHGEVERLYISADADGLRAHYRPAQAPVVQQVRAIEARRGAAFSVEGYASEYNPQIAGWLSGVRSMLARGLVLVVDYGYPVQEYYLDERDRGTLISHYRHRALADPLRYPGLQDITAFVDFSAVAHAAVEQGFAVSGYTSQASFLMGSGLAELHEREASGDPAQLLRLSQQIKTLTLPSEMGERFKAMALTVDHDDPLIGFGLQDYRNRL